MKFLELFKKTGLISAHRGASSEHPENTLRALRAAIGRCDFMEVDVEISSDCVAIIIHDATLGATTNVKEFEKYSDRKPYRVCDFTYEELKELDYGTWYDGKFEPLFTLSDLLLFIKENQVFVNIEIKDMHKNFSDKQVVSIIQKELEQMDVNNFIMFSSFRHQYLPLCKDIMPNIPTAALVEGEHPKNLISYLKELGVDSYNLNDELVDEVVVKKLRAAGIVVNVYTVDSKQRQKELFAMGVNGVFTNILE